MRTLNPHLKASKERYIFPLIEEKISTLSSAYPLIDLSVGDIKYPLSENIVLAFQEAIKEMGEKAIGYGPSCGYDFLRKRIQEKEYPQFSFEEIFISDGINSDLCNLPDLFSADATVLVMDPTYPVHWKTHLMAGKKVIFQNWQDLTPPNTRVDLLYLCSPANPTGIAMTYDQLKAWVDYALKNESLIIFDAAYAAFVRSPNVPRSIYEIPHAEKVAIELKSFSKSHGFTGLRCSYALVPSAMGPLQKMWKNRVETKSNGVSYPIQKAAFVALSEPLTAVSIYQKNADLLRETLQNKFFTVYGGLDSPYLFVKTPDGYNSWEAFSYFAKEFGIVTIPGIGFGEAGEGFIRFSCFAKEEVMEEACLRLKDAACAMK